MDRAQLIYGVAVVGTAVVLVAVSAWAGIRNSSGGTPDTDAAEPTGVASLGPDPSPTLRSSPTRVAPQPSTSTRGANPDARPGPGDTGIPAGTALSGYTGSCTITKAGTVISAKVVNCSPLEIKTTGVRITRSRVVGGVETGRGDTAGAPIKVTVEQSELIGNETWRGIGDSDYVVRDSYIHGGYSGGYCHRNCRIEDNYIAGSSDHASGFRLLRDAVFAGNTLWCKRGIPDTDGGCSSDLTMYQEFGIVQNVLIQGNLFKSTPAWYCARGGDAGSENQPGNSTRVRFVDNVFEAGPYGVCSEQDGGAPIGYFDIGREGNAWTNNKYSDGRAIPPPTP